MTILLNGRGGIACVADKNLLGADYDINCVFEGFDVKLPVHVSELHEVQGGKVARGVIEKHVFRARVGCVDPIRVRAWMPIVDYRVELDSGVAANVGGLGHLSHKVPGLVDVCDLMIRNISCLPLLVLYHGVHELICDSDAVVGVLEEDRAVGFSVDGSVVTCVD